MLKETIESLNLKPGQVAVDCTLGLGGHSIEILKRIGPKGSLFAFEKDERNLVIAKARLEEVAGNFEIFHDSFASLKDRLRGKGCDQINAIIFDLGLSSPHVDQPERGFSFRKDGPLDMRFDASKGFTAADILNSWPEEKVAEIFWKYGEERRSRKLAKAVKMQKITTTLELARLVEKVLGENRVAAIFQSLRIAVNEELEALELALTQAIELLAPQGRVVVLSYHSLEDRIVKTIFKQFATDLRDPTDLFGGRVLRPKVLSLLSKKPILPSQEEVNINPRARSAKMRVAEKL